MTRRHLALWAIVGALLGAWISPGRAYAAPYDPGAVRVVSVGHVGGGAYRLKVSTGNVYRLPPCRYEDSPRCVWDAGRRGNGHGQSFAILPGGRMVTIPARLIWRA